jgi:DNA-directed RNA polymerase subunit RPC12/RpoP
MPTTKKTKTVHKCADCKKEFPGSGKRGRPFKLCPACRKK